MAKGNPNDSSMRTGVSMHVYDDVAESLKPLYIAPDATNLVRGDVYLTDYPNNALDAQTGVTAITPRGVSENLTAGLVSDAKLAAQAAEAAAKAAQALVDSIEGIVKGEVQEVLGESIKEAIQAVLDEYIVDIEHGGTGATNKEDAKKNLEVPEKLDIEIPLPIEKGGTNGVNARAARENLGLGTLAVENAPLSVEKGGTGADNTEQAKTNLEIPDPVELPLAIESGGTGATDADTARTNLQIIPLETQEIDELLEEDV